MLSPRLRTLTRTLRATCSRRPTELSWTPGQTTVIWGCSGKWRRCGQDTSASLQLWGPLAPLGEQMRPLFQAGTADERISPFSITSWSYRYVGLTGYIYKILSYVNSKTTTLGGKGDRRQSRALSRVTQPVNGRTATGTQSFYLQTVSFQLHPLPPKMTVED